MGHVDISLQVVVPKKTLHCQDRIDAEHKDLQLAYFKAHSVVSSMLGRERFGAGGI